jgi:hypothetical protein
MPSPSQPTDDRFKEAIGRGLSLADAICNESAACRAKVLPALGGALTAVWSEQLREELAQDVERTIDLLAEVIHLARRTEGVASLDELPADRLPDGPRTSPPRSIRAP